MENIIEGPFGREPEAWVKNPENIKRLLDIENKLFVIAHADRLTREEYDERSRLEAEKGRILRGESEGASALQACG